MTNEEQSQRREVEQRAFDMIRESGVLNPDVTLDRLMEVSSELSAIAELRETTFIFEHFIYKRVED